MENYKIASKSHIELPNVKECDATEAKTEFQKLITQKSYPCQEVASTKSAI